MAPTEAQFRIRAGADGYGAPTGFSTADHFAQYFSPSIGGGEPTVFSMLDRMPEGVSGCRNCNGTDSRGLKPFQFRLAISECIILKWYKIHFYLSNFSLQI